MSTTDAYRSEMIMPEAAAVRIPADIKERLLRIRLRAAPEAGRMLSMGEMIGILITVGENHFPETMEIIRSDSASQP
jgi:hypothetical protein